MGEAGISVTMQTMAVAGRPKLRLTLLPPPTRRSDPLAIVDLARGAEVLLLAVAGDETLQAVDREGEMALNVLNALGLPSVVAAVQGQPGENPSMKDRSAARKRAEKAITSQVAGEHKVFHVDTAADCQQLIRHLAEHPVSVPHWRQQRPSIMVEAADFRPSAEPAAAEASTSGAGVTGTLMLTGYVRYAGLSANQLISIPGAGDFHIERIEGPVEPLPAGGKSHGRSTDMDMAGTEPALLAQVGHGGGVYGAWGW